MELKQRNNSLLMFGCILSVLSGIGSAGTSTYSFTAFAAPFSDIFGFLCVGILGVIMICGAILPYRLRASRLKQEGDCYEAEITDAYYVDHYRVGPSFVVECVYTNRDGKRYIVKAKDLCPVNGMPAYDAKGNFTAKVWVNPNNLQDYYVGVMFDSLKGDDTDQFDNDYS